MSRAAGTLVKAPFGEIATRPPPSMATKRSPANLPKPGAATTGEPRGAGRSVATTTVPPAQSTSTTTPLSPAVPTTNMSPPNLPVVSKAIPVTRVIAPEEANSLATPRSSMRVITITSRSTRAA